MPDWVCLYFKSVGIRGWFALSVIMSAVLLAERLMKAEWFKGKYVLWTAAVLFLAVAPILAFRNLYFEKTSKLLEPTEEFRPFDNGIRGEMKKEISLLKGDGIDAVTIWVEKGNENRIKLSDELRDVISSAGIHSRVQPQISFGIPNHPVELIYPFVQDELAQRLAFAISVSVKRQIYFVTDRKRRHGLFGIWIYGTPLFEPDGSVTFH